MRWTRALIAFSLLLTMVAAGSAAAPVSERSSYIVVFEPGATANVESTARQLTRAHGGELGFVYQHALRGFSANLSAQAASALARNPMVAYVEADQLASIQAQEVPTGIKRIFADANTAIEIDSVDDWRVDVDVAVIDTGIASHPDLNLVASVNCSGGSPFKQSCSNGGSDDNGHGTHVAGTIAALDNGIGVVGVAPGARLWSVKVLRSDGSGYISWIIAGIDYVTANAAAIEVANMSLGGAFSSAAMDTAIANSVAKGVAYAVAAGNSSSDASGFSPANHPHVLTVSALADFNGEPGGGATATCRSDVDDTFANFSNFGKTTVDIIAPGVCIRSTVPGGYATYSGTSMASPHAAGALALLASTKRATSQVSVLGLYDVLTSNGNFDWFTNTDPDGVPDPLLDVSNSSVFSPKLIAGSGEGGSEPPPGDEDPPPDDEEPPPTDDSPLSGSSTASGRTWTATVTFTGAPDASTSGTWSHNSAADGCSITTGTSCAFAISLPRSVSSVTYTDGVTNESVTINKP